MASSSFPQKQPSGNFGMNIFSCWGGLGHPSFGVSGARSRSLEAEMMGSSSDLSEEKLVREMTQGVGAFFSYHL